MALGPLGGAVRLLRQLDDASQTDRQLLEAFATGDRALAFGRLIERHGAMVYGVCKRVLRNTARIAADKETAEHDVWKGQLQNSFQEYTVRK